MSELNAKIDDLLIGVPGRIVDENWVQGAIEVLNLAYVKDKPKIDNGQPISNLVAEADILSLLFQACGDADNGMFKACTYDSGKYEVTCATVELKRFVALVEPVIRAKAINECVEAVERECNDLNGSCLQYTKAEKIGFNEAIGAIKALNKLRK